MRKLFAILLVMVSVAAFAQENYTDFLPDVSWRTEIENVRWIAPDTFEVQVRPIDWNDEGAFEFIIGNYLKDNKGRNYKIISSAPSGIYYIITVVDVYKSGAAPFQGKIGFVQNSPGGDRSYGVSVNDFEELDNKAIEYSRPIDNRILWEHGQTIPFDSMRLWTGYTPTGTEPIGTKYWDVDNEAVSTVLPDGVIHQEGQELFSHVKNQTGSILLNGHVAAYYGTLGASGRNLAGYGIADYDIMPPFAILGLFTQDIENGGEGKVTAYGDVRGIQTDGVNFGESWVAGDTLWVSTTNLGYITNSEPQAPDPAIFIGVVKYAHATNGTISVKPNYPIRLEELSDVDGVAPNATGDMLTWNNEDSVWYRNAYNINDYVPDSIWNNINSAARLYGGEITDNGDGTVHINAGAGIVKELNAGPEDIPQSINDGQASVLYYVRWDDVASLTLTDNAYNFIYLDGSDGTIKVTTDFYTISFTQDFTLGRAYREGSSVIARLCGTNAWNFNRRVQLFGEEVFPVVRGTGLIISAVGTLQFSISSGVLWAGLVNRFSVSSFDGTTTSFNYWYRDGVGGWNSTTATAIDNVSYDDGSGTLAALIAQRYGVHWVFEDHTGTVHVVYGRDSYTEAGAALASVPYDLPGIVDAYAALIGKIVVQKGGTEFYSIQSAFEEQFGFEQIPTVLHNDLPGLDGGEPGYYGHITIAERQAWSDAADSIPALRLDVDQNSTNIQINADSITAHRIDIDQNTTDISTHIAADLDTDPTNELQDISGIAINSDSIAAHRLDIDQNASDISDHVAADNDTDPTNELQDISGISSNADSIVAHRIDIDQNATDISVHVAADLDTDPTNELQDISGIAENSDSIAAHRINIDQNKSDIDAHVASDLDTDPTNELQDISGISQNADSIAAHRIDIDQNSSDIASHVASDLDTDPTNELDNTDDQTLDLTGDILSIEDGNFVDLSGYDNPGTDDQTISTTGAAGNISIEDGNTITLNVNDADSDPTNEIQDISGIAINASNVSDLQDTAAVHRIELDYLQSISHDAVTLGGALDYLTLAGQVLTMHQINLATDVTGQLGDANISSSSEWDQGYSHAQSDNDISATNEIQTITSNDGSVTVTPSGINYDLSVDIPTPETGSQGVSLYDTIVSVAHGLSIEKWLSYSSTGVIQYAQADTAIDADVIGLSVYVSADTIVYQYSGIYTGGTWTEGANYFLSTTVAGEEVTDQLYYNGDVYLFLGTGVENGLNIEIDAGYVINTEEYVTSNSLQDTLSDYILRQELLDSLSNIDVSSAKITSVTYENDTLTIVEGSSTFKTEIISGSAGTLDTTYVYHTIWAEESVSLTTGTKFAFGNGDESPTGPVIGYDCELVGMGISVDGTISATVRANLNQASTGKSVTISSATKGYVRFDESPVSISAGDRLTFECTSGSGGNATIASAVIRQMVVTSEGPKGDKGDQGEPGLVTTVNKTYIQNGTGTTATAVNDSIYKIDLTDNGIEAAKLEATNTPTDDYVPSYDAASGGFTWVEQSSGGSSFSGVSCYNTSANPLRTEPCPLTEEFDTDGYHNTSNSTRITVPTTGKYRVTIEASVTYSSTTAYCSIILRKNGSSLKVWKDSEDEGWDEGATHFVSRIFQFNANDYLEIIISPYTVSTSWTIAAGGIYFQVERLD